MAVFTDRILILLAATCVIHFVEARAGICPNPTTGKTVHYDLSSQICCGGKVFSVESGAQGTCCGAQTYSPRNEICCGGKIRSRSSGHECCAFRHWYDPLTHICCGDRVYAKENGLYKCCGTVAYNTLEETCCPVETDQDYQWGQMITRRGVGQCCGSKLIDPDQEICCRGVSHQRTSPFESCCGNSTYDQLSGACCDDQSPYNPITHVCCSGTVHLAENGAVCCEKESYRPSESSCCHGTVFMGIPEVPRVQSCCGGVSYLKTDQLCCDGSLHSRGNNIDCCGRDTYNASSELCCRLGEETIIHQKTSSIEECCGLSTFDTKSQTCCEAGSQIFDLAGGQCCRNALGEVEAYDPNFGTCCSGDQGEILFMGISSNQSRCCGFNLMSEHDLCYPLDETLVRKSSFTDNAICPGPITAITYNSATQICVGEGRIEELSANVDICGTNLYDPTAEICCEGFIRGRFDENWNERSCCSGTSDTFAPDLQTCCAGNIHNIPTAQSRCCRTKAYDPATHMCHETGLVRSLQEIAVYPSLCDHTPYDPALHTCCGRTLIAAGQPCCMGIPAFLPDEVNGGQCCGFYAFDPNSQICCKGMTHRREGDATCCGYDILTDSDSQICCDGHLHLREGGRNSCEDRVAYNPHTETVCGGLVHSIPNGSCCKHQAYDNNAHTCCNGYLHPKTNETLSCCGTNVYDKQDPAVFCCNGHLIHGDTNSECCGDATIDPFRQTCCQTDESSFILPRMPNPSQNLLTCCDINTYQSQQHTCCGGVEHKFVANGQCCGLDVIRNPTEEICCGGRTVHRSYGQHTECCSGRIIDNREVTCCNDHIIPPDGFDQCCGDQIINSMYKTCCGGESYDKSNNTVDCCSGVMYSIATQACDEEHGVIVSQRNSTPSTTEGRVDILNFLCSENDGAERNDEGNEYICCGGTRFPTSNGKTACCSGTAYNPTNSDCCQGFLHDKVEKAECCGASYYQPAKEICCRGGAVVSRLRGQSCPDSFHLSSIEATEETLQCECNLFSLGRKISSKCAKMLRSKPSIFVGIVVDAPEGTPQSYNIRFTDALRGRIPRNSTDAGEDDTVLVVMSQHAWCQVTSFKRDQKVVVFMDSGSRLDGSIIQHTSNDVILPFNRKVGRRLRYILN